MTTPRRAHRAGSPGDDPAEFVALVRTYDDRLRRLASRMLVDRNRVDDVLQEAYVRAHRALPSFRTESDLGTWLYRITYNCCIDELRSAGRRPRPLAVVPDHADPGSGPGRQVAVRQAVRAALAELPEDQRAAVLLVDGNALDYAAAAEVLGIPRGTVASRVARARRVLRSRLRIDQEASDDQRS